MEKFYKIFRAGFFPPKVVLQSNSGPAPLITISREMGSGGKSTANLIASQLGEPWKVYDHELIDKIAKNKKLEEELIESIDPKRLPLVDIITTKTFGKRFSHLSGYQRHLIKVMTLVGLKGYSIILGRGANFLFPHALNIRIICLFDQRIIWQMTYEHISRPEAIKRIEDSDKERREFVESLFNHNNTKAYHYDLVIRTGPNISIEDAANITIDLTKRKFKV
ncbi:MAG: cytidylate kinase-like family protein [Patescibacteria group bacterium]|jgi:cytidylate kinase